jgi:hypothetical protein
MLDYIGRFTLVGIVEIYEQCFHSIKTKLFQMLSISFLFGCVFGINNVMTPVLCLQSCISIFVSHHPDDIISDGSQHWIDGGSSAIIGEQS